MNYLELHIYIHTESGIQYDIMPTNFINTQKIVYIFIAILFTSCFC